MNLSHIRRIATLTLNNIIINNRNKSSFNTASAPCWAIDDHTRYPGTGTTTPDSLKALYIIDNSVEVHILRDFYRVEFESYAYEYHNPYQSWSPL